MRNTTKALSNVIFGLALSAGDEVIVTDQDYGTFPDAWVQRCSDAKMEYQRTCLKDAARQRSL